MTAVDPNIVELDKMGEKLRIARVGRGLRLKDVADRSGYSVSFLSQIERGQANPSVGALKHIADALGIPAASLFFEAAQGLQGESSSAARREPPLVAEMVPKDRRKTLAYPDADITYELLVPDLRHELEVMWVEAPPGAATGEAYAHEGEECVVVLDGELTVTVGDESWHLRTGDALRFAGTVPHAWANPGNAHARAIWISTPPTF